MIEFCDTFIFHAILKWITLTFTRFVLYFATEFYNFVIPVLFLKNLTFEFSNVLIPYFNGITSLVTTAIK